MDKGQAKVQRHSGPIARRPVRDPLCLNNPVSEPTILAMGLRLNRRWLGRFHVAALHGRGKSRSITAFAMRLDRLSSSSQMPPKAGPNWRISTLTSKRRASCRRASAVSDVSANNSANCPGVMLSTMQATNTVRSSSGNSSITTESESRSLRRVRMDYGGESD